MAGYQEEAVKAAIRDTGSRDSDAVKVAYAAYTASMIAQGQPYKQLRDI